MICLKIFLVALVITSVPNAIHAVYTQADLDRILAYKVKFFGFETTIGNIYGDPRPTVDNFNPGDNLRSLVMGERPVNIDFEDPTHRAVRHQRPEKFFLRMFYDQPITELKSLSETNPRPPAVISIIGEQGSGKSELLEFIEMSLRKGFRRNEWIIRVDMDYITLMINGPQVTFEDIVERVLPWDFDDLFYNVYEINPSRIIFLLDGIDQIPHSQVNHVLSVVSDIIKKGSTVVTTSYNDLTPSICQPSHGLCKTFQIPEMASIETEKFLYNFWRDNQDVRDWLLEPDRLYPDELYRDYAKVVTQALEKLKIPRTVRAIEVLANQLIAARPMGIFDSGHSTRQFSLTRYINDYYHLGYSQSTDLVRRTNNMRLNSNTLYNQLVGILAIPIPGDFMRNLYSSVYGPYAFKQLMGSKIKIAYTVHDVYLKSAEQKIRERGTTPFKYMKFNPQGQPIGFFRPEYQAFYAAKYILNSLSGFPLPSTRGFREVLENSKHTRVVEFINSGIQDLESTQPLLTALNQISISSDDSLNTKILDNLIKNGFDDLCSLLFDEIKNLGRLEELKAYLQNTDPLITETKYVFGLRSDMPETRRNSPTMTGTRQELMLRMSMVKSTENLGRFSIPISLADHMLVKLGKIAIEQDNYRLFDAFIKRVPAAFMRSENLGLIIFYAIEMTGITNFRQMDYIRGGIDGKDILVNGRTLTHAAMKWPGKEVLQYVIDKLGAPTNDQPNILGITPTIELLKSNPYPYYSPEGFFEKTLFWAERRDPVPLVLPEAEKLWSYVPILNDIPPEHRRLLINDQASTSTHITPDQLRIIPSQDLPFEVKNVRMKLVFKQCLMERPIPPHSVANDINHVIFAEVIAYYRGHDTLPPAEESNFDGTIRTSCERELRPNNPVSAKHIVKTLVSNTISEEECRRIHVTISDFIQRETEQHHLGELYKLLNSRYNNWITFYGHSFGDLVLRSRAAIFPGLIRDPRPVRHHNMIDLFGEPEDNNAERSPSDGYESCASDRSRRSLNFKCLFSRKDVKKFVEDHEFDNVRRIIINVDAFLNYVLRVEIVEPMKAKQLIEFAKEILENPTNKKAIIGKYQTLFDEILRHGSFREYVENRRFVEGISEVKDTKPTKNALSKLYSSLSSQKRIFASSVMAIPLIKSLYDTILVCANLPSSYECKYATLMVTIHSGLMIGSHYTHKFFYTKIDATMTKLISVVPAELKVARTELMALRQRKLTVTARRVDAGFILIGVLIDIPNIYHSITTLISCAKPESACTSQEIGAAGTMLGGFLASVGSSIGVMFLRLGMFAAGAIGVALMAALMVANAINNLVYYHNTYHTNTDEEFRTFWPSLINMKPPQDVQNLMNYTDRVVALDNNIYQYLSDSGENVVAYAMGIGNIVNGKFMATEGYINMAVRSDSNTRGLSRVQPRGRSDVLHLCLLKKVPNEQFEAQGEFVPHQDARYECNNAVVIANSERWNNRHEDKSSIVYNLAAIHKGEVIGSDIVNNMFQLSDSTAHLKVTGGPSKLMNFYVVTSDGFHGTIVFGRTSRQEILDLSHVPQEHVLSFYWHHELMGMVLYSPDGYQCFNMVSKNRKTLDLQVIGRTNKPDFIQCADPTNLITHQRHPLSVDGGGGEESAWDTIIGCQFARFRPFTHIFGMGYDTMDMVQIQLDANTNTAVRKVYSTIQPNKSFIGVRFTNRPILLFTRSLIYNPTEKTLTWEFYYDDSTIMVLDIMPYYRAASPGSSRGNLVNATHVQTVTCLFFDDYLNVTIQPIIRLAENNVHPLRIHQWNAFAGIKSSTVQEAQTEYQRLIPFMKSNTSVYLTNNMTNETFVYGSAISDELLISQNTIMVHGGEGSDIYIIDSESIEYIRINNQDDGYDVDFLMLSCGSLRAEKSLIKLSDLDDPLYDVKLTCISSQSSHSTDVILQNYLMHDVYKHLIINYNSLYYVILPQHWLQENYYKEVLELGLFVAYEQMKPDTALVLHASDTYVIFNVTNKDRDCIAFKFGYDVNLAFEKKKTANLTLIVLKNFFTSKSGHNISTDWLKNRIFIVGENINNKTIPTTFDAQKILDLIGKTTHNTDETLDFVYKRYLVDATSVSDTIIDHNNNDMSTSERKFGVIEVKNGEPGDFRAKWTNSNILSLCTNKMCINIKNWCSSVEQRINRMEFHTSYFRPIISVRYMDQLACESQTGNDRLVSRLNDKLQKAQKRLELSYDNSDYSRLLLCVSYLYADYITLSMNYKLFGFVDYDDKLKFIRSNCVRLFALDNVDYIDGDFQSDINAMLRNEIEIYKSSDDDWVPDQPVINFLLKNINQVSDNDWLKFVSDLSNVYLKNEFNVDFSLLPNMQEIFSLNLCVGKVVVLDRNSNPGY